MANIKSKKRRKLLIIVLTLLVLGAVAGGWFFRKKDAPIIVQTEKVTRRNITELVVANGKIQPVLQVVINPEVSGEITEMPVREGQRVQKGDLLVKIKPENYQAVRNSCEATYRSALASKTLAQANLTRAELDFKRAEKLLENKLLSDTQFLEAKTTWEVMKATYETSGHQVAQCQASLAKAEDDLSKTIINAPMAGTVTRLRSQIGERVVGTALMAGTEIMTVANLEEMEARVDIGEVDVILIAVGQTAHLEVDAFRNRKFVGTVTEIANSSKSASSGSSTVQQDATKFEVKIRITEKEIFRPGMSVTAEIETRSRTNVLTVPIQSVTSRRPKKPDDKKAGVTNSASATESNKPPVVAQSATNSSTNSTVASRDKKSAEAAKATPVVFLLDGEKVKMLPVKSGISDDTYVEITEGLKEGQEIVSGGYKAINRLLEDGKKVKIGTPEVETDKPENK